MHRHLDARRAGAIQRLVLMVAVLATVAGCTSNEPGGTPTEPDGAIAYATYEPTSPFGTGDGAAIEGVLEDRDGCLVVAHESGTTAVPVLPATSTTWSDDGGGTLTLDGVAHRLGAEVAFGGGMLGATGVDATVPDACDGHGELFLVSSQAP